jgi:NADH dehydrogenase
VVIVGAGFAGLAVARGLEHARVEVTLVDRNNFTTFQPLLYQVATAGLNPADVAHPVRDLFHRQRNVRVRRDEVIGVDWDRRTVVLAEHAEVPFDHLVLAVGATTSWFSVPGALQHALPLYTVEDALIVRNHVVARFEAADAELGLGLRHVGPRSTHHPRR